LEMMHERSPTSDKARQNTKIKMRNPSDADLNRALYSKHCGQCCAEQLDKKSRCAVGVQEEQTLVFAEADETSAESFLTIFETHARAELSAAPRVCKERRSVDLHGACVGKST
jgi:hypothetical protein